MPKLSQVWVRDHTRLHGRRREEIAGCMKRESVIPQRETGWRLRGLWRNETKVGLRLSGRFLQLEIPLRGFVSGGS